MKNFITLFSFFFLLQSCGEQVRNPDSQFDNKIEHSASKIVNEFAIVIHGGAGTI